MQKDNIVENDTDHLSFLVQKVMMQKTHISILKQKAKDKVIAEDDANIKYFHAKWKDNIRRNCIARVIDEQGKSFTNNKEIAEVFLTLN